MNILLTGGVGYIGSHIAVALVEAGHRVILYDNLCNSNASIVDRLRKITGKNFPLIIGDVRNLSLLTHVMKKHQVDAVIHLAGLKAVGESVEKPLEYYSNNVGGTVSLLQAMLVANVEILVFSSSACVYGDPLYLPIDEDHPLRAVNPYGRSKIQIEEILTDVAKSDHEWRIASLRYFNPVGAHDSGLIGENPNGVPNNLMPFISRVASGQMAELAIFGDDYHTIDGTGVRDYIHVMDLAEGHLAALNYLDRVVGLCVFNLGAGEGHSVLEMVRVFEAASGRSVPYKIVPRRPGDVPSCYAKVNKAAKILQWMTKRSLLDMCVSAWRFQSNSVL